MDVKEIMKSIIESGGNVAMIQRPARKIRGKKEKPDLLPNSFSEFVGQEKAKELIKTAINSAVIQEKPIQHILLLGNPGVGKSTLAFLAGEYAKREVIALTSSGLESPMDVYTIFEEIQDKQNPIIMLDELQTLPKKLAELFYVPMEVSGTEIIMPKSEKRIKVPPMTIIGATAGEQGGIPKPMLDRFGLKIMLELYTFKNMEKLVYQSAEKLSVGIKDAGVEEIVRRSFLTPRIANNYLRTVKDYLIANSEPMASVSILETIFGLLNIDEFGLDKKAIEILNILNNNNGKMGLNTLATCIGTDTETLKYIYEPQLLSLKLIGYKSTGRFITSIGVQYLEGDK